MTDIVGCFGMGMTTTTTTTTEILGENLPGQATQPVRGI